MNTMKITYGILVIIGILLTGFAGITFSNRITASVLQVKEHADELASGNLRLDDIQVDSQDGTLLALHQAYYVIKVLISSLTFVTVPP